MGREAGASPSGSSSRGTPRWPWRQARKRGD
jgi:hypothetical protein